MMLKPAVKTKSTGDLSLAALQDLDARVQARTRELAKVNEALQAEITERKRAEDALRLMVEGTASVTGDDFFRSLVYNLAFALQVRYAFVSEYVEGSTTRVRTLAFWKAADFGDNFEYGLDGTPCESVLGGDLCYYPRGVQELFPRDVDLVSLGAQSYLGVPLFHSGGEVIGHLAVLDDKAMEDEQRRKSMLKIFAARAGAELERKRAETALRLIVEGTSSVTGDEFFHSLVSNLAQALQVRYAFVSEYVPGFKNRVRTLAFWTGKVFGDNFEYGLTGTPCESVLGGHLCYYPREVQQLFPLDLDLVALGAQSYLGVPLFDSHGEVIGHLAVLDDKAMGDEARRKSILKIFAARAGAEMERQYAQFILTKRALELETVAHVSTAASTILNADRLLQEVVDLTQASFGLYHAHSYLLDDSKQTLELTVGAGEVGQVMVAEGRRIPLNKEQSLVARAARTRQGVIVNDVHADPGFLSHPLLPDTRAELAVPMLVGENVIGVFDVQATTVNQFTAEDVKIQTTLAAQIAVALRNAHLYAEQISIVERLRELDHLKSTFLANMSHELRTPLNSIIGFTEIMIDGLNGPLNDRMERDLDIVYKNGQHLLNLINDVLDMAKIEAGKMKLNLERIDLREVLDEVLAIAGPLARDKELALAIDADPALELHLSADRIRLRQVLLNLVSNAIKFTEQGRVTLQTSRVNGTVRVAVSDTGLGIPPEQLKSIFEAFSQVDTTATRKVGGTGLGLTISRRLVEMHGGTLWAESTGFPGEGTRFFMDLPASHARPALASTDNDNG